MRAGSLCSPKGLVDRLVESRKEHEDERPQALGCEEVTSSRP